MDLTGDERRALAFIAGLLFLSVVVRVAALPERVDPPGVRLDLTAHIAATEQAVAEAERMREPLAPGERIDPNTAPVVELARLPRVGPALARRIVEDRERAGPYRWTGDLKRVPGVGDRLVELAAPHLALPDVAPPSVAGGGPERREGATRGPARGAGGAVGGAGGPGAGSGAVDVNRASAAELEALPGVGPVLAARIVAYRDSAGPFESPEDLLAVRGVGPAMLARFRDRVRTGW
jgi:competence ComEA-like helix-hairpin-helix protein